MLILFLAIMLIGLAAFAFVLTSALKGPAITQKVSLKGFDLTGQPSSPEQAPVQPKLAVADEPAQILELKALCQASDVKIAKLEEMLAEKNRMITELQQGLKAGQDQDGHLEDIKQILQAEIEDLKQHNKQLKEELSHLSDENLDLQTRVYGAKTIQGGASQDIKVTSGSLSLHDVFGAEDTEGTVH